MCKHCLIFFIFFLFFVIPASCDQALVISWDGSVFRADTTFVRIDGRDTYSNVHLEEVAYRGNVYSYEEIDEMISKNNYSTIFFIYFDGMNSFKLQGNPFDLEDVLDDARVTAMKKGFTWTEPIRSMPLILEPTVVNQITPEVTVETPEQVQTVTPTAPLPKNDYVFPSNDTVDFTPIFFLISIPFLAAIVYAVLKPSQPKKGPAEEHVEYLTPVQKTYEERYSEPMPDPLAAKKTELNKLLKNIKESISRPNTSDPSSRSVWIDNMIQNESKLDENIPKKELLKLVTLYLKIRGTDPSEALLEDILIEERPISENIQVADVYYDIKARTLSADLLTRQEVDYLLGLFSRYRENELKSVKTVYYLLIGKSISNIK
ncbi:TPA: hypothetical protein ENS27_19735 [bacterium]|nr:hypothetical protein [bacterium]